MLMLIGLSLMASVVGNFHFLAQFIRLQGLLLVEAIS